MSLIDEIKQRQAGTIQAEVQNMDAQMVEQSKPSAMESMKESRSAHRQSMSSVPDQELVEEPAEPEEQEMHTNLEKAMINLIHGKGKSQKLLKAVFSASDHVKGIGDISSDIVMMLREQNPNATEDVLASLGERAVEEIVELVEIADPSIDLDQDDMAEAYSIGLQNYMKANSADVDEVELRGFLANG